MARHSTHDFSLLQQDLDGVTVLPPPPPPGFSVVLTGGTGANGWGAPVLGTVAITDAPSDLILVAELVGGPPDSVAVVGEVA